MVPIRSAKEKDIEQIVSVHMRAFEGFFLTLMGREFLEELYRSFAVEEDGTCIVAVAQDRVVGFAAGTLYPERFFRKLRRKHWHTFLLRSLRVLFRRPFRTTRKLISALSYKGDQPRSHKEAALLSSIAVDPDFKVRKISILGHAETPGLGDEIEAESFQNQFIGKGPDHLTVLKTETTDYIQAISGATISSRAVAEDAVKAGLDFLITTMTDKSEE